MKPGRNELCLCESGKKFKKCCGGPNPPDRLPNQAFARQTQIASRHEKCCHPLASAENCETIINAHTVQRKSSLESVVDDRRKLLTFYRAPWRDAPFRTPREVGWKEASVFRGFCGLHDGMFAPVETGAFKPSKETCFLLTFRALCLELFRKEASVIAHPVIKPLIYKSFEPEDWDLATHFREVQNAGTRKGLVDLTTLKAWADKSWISSNYTEWDFCVLEFDGEVCLTATGGLNPPFDLDGNPIQVLHDRTRMSQGLFVSLVRGTSGPRAVFGWHSSATAAKRYVESLVGKPALAVSRILAQIVFAHIENSFFSHSWWRDLSEAERMWLTRLADCEPYSHHPGYGEEQFVPWTLRNVSWL